MKKRFLTTLVTGLVLLGMVGVSQALTLQIGDYAPVTYADGTPVLGGGLLLAGSTGPGVPDILLDIESLMLSTYSISIDVVNDNKKELSLYKSDVSGSSSVDSGLLKDSYNTVFSYTATQPANANITYSSGNIVGPDAYLLVKDGNHTPVWYFFDLDYLKWNGSDEIILKGFWPEDGSISHVSLYGKEAPIPEPATTLLFGTGLAGLAAVGRRRKN